MICEVKRAIIMAAGFGSRLQPLTSNTPKPLINVNGIPMIESIIKALKQNEINEIIVVVGYLKEKFDYLKDKYTNLKLVENPYFEKCNNISSLYVVKEFIPESVILDGDQIVCHPSFLKKEFNQSGYCCLWTDKPTTEWVLQSEKGRVTSCFRNGADQGWELHSISYWNKKDGYMLQKDIEEIFIKQQKTDLYWDDIALFEKPDHYSLTIYPFEQGDIIEIDDWETLMSIDGRYKRREEYEKN